MSDKSIHEGKNWLEEKKSGRVNEDGELLIGSSWFDEENVGRVDEDGNVYKGRSRLTEEKVGRIDDKGNVYRGRSWVTEEKVGRVDGKGNIQKGRNWFAEEKVGRTDSKDGGASLLLGKEKNKPEKRYRVASGGGGSAGSGFGDMSGWVILAMLPAIVLFGAIGFLYHATLGTRFADTAVARMIHAPVEAVADNYAVAYALVSLFWFSIMSIKPEWSYFTLVIGALAHPLLIGLFTAVVGILVPLALFLSMVAGDLDRAWSYENLHLLLYAFLCLVPYYVVGILIKPMNDRLRTIVGILSIAGMFAFALVKGGETAELRKDNKASKGIGQIEKIAASNNVQGNYFKYYIVVKSTKNLQAGMNLAKSLEYKGYNSNLIQSNNGYYAVSIERFNRLDWAKEKLTSLKNRAVVPSDAFIMSEKRISRVIYSGFSHDEMLDL